MENRTLIRQSKQWVPTEPAVHTARDMRERTRDFAIRIMRLYAALPRRPEAQVIGKQMLRCGTGLGANYREGLRARSKSEYAAKLNIGLMEGEETLYWVELLEAAHIMPADRLTELKIELSEIMAILVTLIKKARIEAARRACAVDDLESR